MGEISISTLTQSYNYITTVEQVGQVLQEIEWYKQFFVDKRIKLGLDLETYFTDEYFREVMLRYTDNPVPRPIKIFDTWEGIPRLIQIGFDPQYANKQFLLDVQALGNQVIIDNFKDLFEKDAILIGQNLGYDLSFLALQFGIFPEEVRDTMIIAKLRWLGDNLLNDHSTASFSLAGLYDRCILPSVFKALTGMSTEEYEAYKKTNQKSDWSATLDKDQLNYAADDVRLIFYVYDSLLEECTKFKKKYPQSGILDMIKSECEAVLEYGLMGDVGVGFDSDYHKNVLIPYYEKRANDAEEILVKITECWFEDRGVLKCPKTNPHYVSQCKFADFASSQQTAKVLTENLGFDLPKTEKGNLSVAGDIINELFWESEPSKERDILEQIIKYREARSLLNKNGTNYMEFVHDDGRCYPSIFQIGTDTGRSTIKDPALQTIPNLSVRDFPGYECKNEKDKGFAPHRRSFIAKDGHDLITADFSNQEVRTIGKYSRDPKIIQAFQNNEDLHQKTADNLGVERSEGKLFFLSSQYGAYERRIQRTLYKESGGKFKKTLEEVKEYRAKHFAFYAGLKAEIDRCEQYVRSQMEPFESLCEFKNRRPLIVGFTPTFKMHKTWCLTKEQETNAHYITKFDKVDSLHKNYKVLNKKTQKYSDWGNEYNQRVSAISREYFNFLIQGDCACVLKKAVVSTHKEFRANGWSPYDACIVIVNHDELIVDVRSDLLEKAEEIVYRCMYDSQKLILGKTIPTVIELKAGKSWAVK